MIKKLEKLIEFLRTHLFSISHSDIILTFNRKTQKGFFYLYNFHKFEYAHD